MVDKYEDENAFVAPLACTRPLLLLKPLIANALCHDLACGTNAEINGNVQISLRTTIEKLGRKDMTFPHCDDEGIGTHGMGITSDVILQPKISPLWIPIPSKLLAATGAAMMMQVLSYGDSELAEQVRHSDCQEADGAIPRPINLSSILSEELEIYALKEGSNFDAIKLLDLAGQQSSESLMAHEIRQVEGRSALWLASIAVLAFLSFKDVLNSNRLFFLHPLTCCHLMGCRWCCGCSSPNQRTRDVTGIHLQAPSGWLTMTGATQINCSCWTTSGLKHPLGYNFSPDLVGR
jgi:hypothetical protein